MPTHSAVEAAVDRRRSVGRASVIDVDKQGGSIIAKTIRECTSSFRQISRHHVATARSLLRKPRPARCEGERIKSSREEANRSYSL